MLSKLAGVPAAALKTRKWSPVKIPPKLFKTLFDALTGSNRKASCGLVAGKQKFSMLSIWMHFNGKISNNNKRRQRACKTHSSGQNKIKMLNANWPCWLAGRRRALYPLRGAPVRRRRCIVASTSATVLNVNFNFSSVTTCGEPLSWFGELATLHNFCWNAKWQRPDCFDWAGIIQSQLWVEGGKKKTFPVDARRGEFGPPPYGSLVFNGF